MKGIVTLAIKDLRLLWRDRFGLFWVIAFPLIMALLWGSLYSGNGGAQNIKIGVIDEDGTERSEKYIAKLQKSEALEVTQVNVETAKDEVRKGRLDAYVRLEKGFGELTWSSSEKGLPIELGVDPSKKASRAYMQGVLIKTWFDSMRDVFSNPVEMRKMVKDGIQEIEKESDLSIGQRLVFKTFMFSLDKFLEDVDPKTYSDGEPLGNMEIKTVSVVRNEAHPHSSFDITFPSGILWGLIGCAAAFGISIVSERNSGTLMRIRISPLTRAQILAGKGLACFLACIGVTALLLVIGSSFFRLQVPDPLKAVLAGVCSAICFVGIMMLISVLGKTERAVSGAGWAILLVLAMFGGCMLPLAFMPGWMQTISHFSPVKWCILALEGAIWRQFSYTEMIQPCAILVGGGTVFYAIGVRVFSRTET